QRLDSVLIERQAIHPADEVAKVRLKPVREVLEDRGNVLALVSLKAVATSPATTGIVGCGQRNALVGGTGKQRGLAAARVPGNGDALPVYLLERIEIVNNAMVAPGPGRKPAALVGRIGCIEPATLPAVRRNLHSAELRQNVAALCHIGDDIC